MEIKKMKINFIENKYSWNEMSLLNFLEEGNIPSGWNNFFIDNQKILCEISEKLEEEKKKNSKLIIYPSINQVFRSFILLNKIKVVILGQDPYHSGTTEYDGSAVGYCFSVSHGNRINPSLRNIYKELKLENYDVNENGDLTHWVDQGCFMINTALTVEKGCADSHTAFWHDFTERVIKYVSENCADVVWLLMGAKAHKFSKFIRHKVFCTSHPSPFSAHKGNNKINAFIGSGVFDKINKQLEKYGRKKIKW